ncbi:hypothetical protein R3Q56_004221 [Pseudomonas aeruginosa]|nr:hypothetical protein [Pseudomonas aeruginosa]
MSYMAILRYGVRLERNLVVFGQSLQVVGQRIFDQLLSWSGDEHWSVTPQTCSLFQVVRVGPGIEQRNEILGPAKQDALRQLKQGINH